MVSALAGGKALPAALLEQILTRTDGVPLFVEELTKSILESGELKEAGDHYEYAGCGHAGDSAHAAGLADGAAGSLHAGEGDRPDRRGDRPRVQLRADRRGRADAAGPTRRRPRAAGRVGTGLPPARRPMRSTPSSTRWCRTRRTTRCSEPRRQELHGKIARVIEERFPNIKTTEPEVLAHHFTEAELLERRFRSGRRRAAGAQAHGPDRGHRPSQQGARTGRHLPASAERDASELELRTLLGTAWMALKGWAAAGGLGQPASGAGAGEVAAPQRCAAAHPLGTLGQRTVQRPGRRVAALGRRS